MSGALLCRSKHIGIGRYTDSELVIVIRTTTIMADERVVSDIVTKFLLNTCRLRPRLTRHATQVAVCCAMIATRNQDDNAEADSIPLTTGSFAEFYIEPMLPLVGDVDVMHHRIDQLAIPRGHPPPTQLPAEFSNCVKVNEIVDSHLPGYVYLKLRYLFWTAESTERISRSGDLSLIHI